MDNEFEYTFNPQTPKAEEQPASPQQDIPRFDPESFRRPHAEPFVWQAQSAPMPKPEKKRKTGWTGGKVVALSLVCAILGGIAGAAAVRLIPNSQPAAPSSGTPSSILVGLREAAVIQTHPIDTSKRMTASEVYAANVNSTVGITTSVTTNYWGYQTTRPASGSGFILSDDGYILTNYHVVESSTAISVSLYNGEKHDAALIGYDASNDIAVLKIEAEGLIPVVLGDSDKMNVGDEVVAIGNPLGELTFSLTAGAVSALEREVTTSSGITMNLIQTDCAINSGNSGGALFNLYGEVIGITNAKYSSSSSSEASIDNIGFAIPLNNVRSIVESIIEKGYISKPYIGISVTDVSEDTQSYGLPAGAAVKVVAEGSPAEEGGLRVNDIITKLGDTAVTGSSQLINLVADCQIGDVLHLTVYRQGATIELDITVGEKIQSAQEQTQQAQQPSQQLPSGAVPFWGFGGW